MEKRADILDATVLFFKLPVQLFLFACAGKLRASNYGPRVNCPYIQKCLGIFNSTLGLALIKSFNENIFWNSEFLQNGNSCSLIGARAPAYIYIASIAAGLFHKSPNSHIPRFLHLFTSSQFLLTAIQGWYLVLVSMSENVMSIPLILTMMTGPRHPDAFV